MELCESQEQRDLRAAVAAIARSYGHEYYLAKSLAGEKSSELWQEIGKQGFWGLTSPSSTAVAAPVSTSCRLCARSWLRRVARC